VRRPSSKKSKRMNEGPLDAGTSTRERTNKTAPHRAAGTAIAGVRASASVETHGSGNLL